jgi:uncharacterized protein (TIGR03437 family)
MRRFLSPQFLIAIFPAVSIQAAPIPKVSPRLPVLFERNTGESAAAFPILARGKGYALLLGRSQIQLRRPGAGPATIRFTGASPNAAAELMVPSTTIVNDYTEARKHWVSGAATWQEAQYRELYPGIDLLFYSSNNSGNNSELEYDARIRPGADPGRIAFTCEGERPPRIAPSGDLTIPLGSGTVTWRKPVAYQTIGDRRVPVNVQFAVHGRRIGFSARGWDKRYPLVIDPTLNFSTYLGGSGSDFSRAIGVDSFGNIYLAGITSSGDLPVTAASFQSAYKGGSAYGAPGDAFVAKLNPTATALIYITYLGGTGIDWALGVAADNSGNAYVTGFTDSTDFPVTTGAYQTKFGGDSGDGPAPTGDGFAAKFDPSGKLLWSTYLGGAQDDAGGEIAVDSSGNVIVAGATVSSNFPVTTGAFQAKYGGGNGPITVSSQGYVIINSGDGFVAKLDPTGSKLLASTFLGGSGDDAIAALALDSQGNIWVGGATASANFPVSANAFQSRFGGKSSDALQAIVQLGDGFISEFSADLTKLTYSTYLGGSNDDAITGIAIDSSGAIFACGFTQSANFPVKGPTAGAYHGPAAPANERPFLLGDVFVAKLTTAGGLVFSEYIGGKLDDAAAGMVLDNQGNPIVMGLTNSSDFPVTPDAFQPNYGGVGPPPYDDYGDGFLMQLNGSTGATLYSTFIGGGDSDALAGIAQSASGFTYLVGDTFSTNFPVTPGTIQTAKNSKVSGTADSIVMRFSFATQTLPTIGGVANGASYSTSSYSPGEIVTVFGQNMGPAQAVTAQIDPKTGRIATTLAGAQVLFDGVPAPLVYVLATQSSALIPYEVAGKSSTQMTVSYNNVVSAPVTLKLGAAAPGLFAANQQGTAQGAIVNQDATFNSASNPAPAGTYIALYGTGEGLLNPPGATGQLAPTAPPFPTFAGAISVTIGGVTVPSSAIAYAGPVPGFVEGEFQLNVQIPAGVASGNQAVVVTIGGVASQSNLTVAVK